MKKGEDEKKKGRSRNVEGNEGMKGEEANEERRGWKE